MPTPSNLSSVRAQQASQQESRAELQSSLIFVGVVLLIFFGISLVDQSRRIQGFHSLIPIFLGSMIALGGLMIAIRRGWWHPAVCYVNTTIQVAMVTGFLGVIAVEKGTLFALSTALPMIYCLVISITAFRLKPWLSFYAGALSSLSLVIIYATTMRPQLKPEDFVTYPTITWPSVFGRVIVLAGIGVACAVAARALRQQVQKMTEDENRISLLERTFGRLVAPEVARQILENEDWMRPARREAVVMFADLKGFTQYSEGRSPEDVADFLNQCWSVAADIVERHGGVINKYMGDGFLAIFGVPLALDEAEIAAAQTAGELQEALADFLEPRGLAICIGLHAGPMIVGGIGSESRCEFTVIGSTVNLASRLEGLNRSLQTQCLASEPIAERITKSWEMKHHGGQRVKGVADEVSVYEILRKKAGASEDAPGPESA